MIYWNQPPPSETVPEPTPIEAAPEPESDLIPDTLPEELRTQHAVIVAQSGHGKTQLLQSLILDDMEKDATVIVIDSQSQLINNLLHVVPSNRLVHISPADLEYPLALNLFDGDQDATLYEYIFGALDAEMTSKQAMVYRYLSRLLTVIPGATIDTMREMLEQGGVMQYQQYIDTLPPIVRAFFLNEFNSRQYDETKQQISRRLYTLLENEQFYAMFTAPEMKLSVSKAIDGKAVILIDTAKRILKGDSFKIFGRFFIAQIAQAIFSREYPYGHRVYIYIDEFQEYAGEEEFVQELFTQARKFNVALTVAFQFLDQLPDQVNKAIMANTAIKMVGAVSAPNKRAMAAEFDVKADMFWLPPKGMFRTNLENRIFKVVFGRLEDLGQRSKAELEKIRETTRRLYGYSRYEVKHIDKPTTVVPFADFKDRS